MGCGDGDRAATKQLIIQFSSSGHVVLKPLLHHDPFTPHASPVLVCVQNECLGKRQQLDSETSESSSVSLSKCSHPLSFFFFLPTFSLSVFALLQSFSLFRLSLLKKPNKDKASLSFHAKRNTHLHLVRQC